MGYMHDLAAIYGRCLFNKGLIMTEGRSILISFLYALKIYKKYYLSIRQITFTYIQ